jgi:hypothetical protein
VRERKRERENTRKASTIIEKETNKQKEKKFEDEKCQTVRENEEEQNEKLTDQWTIRRKTKKTTFLLNI